MFQRKLIAVLSVLAVLAVAAGSGHASLSRVEGMGLSVPVLSQFTDDHANIYYYPSSVVRQNNIVVAEIGHNPGGDIPVSTDDQSFTFIRNFPRLGAIAFQMKQNSQNLFEGSSNSNFEQWDIIWGKALTKADFAVRVDIANSYWENKAGTTTESTRGLYLDFFGDPTMPGWFPGPGAALPDFVLDNVELNTFGVTPSISLHMQNENRLDVAVTYRKFTFENKTTDGTGSQTFEDAGNASYALLARMMVHQGDNSTWYPAVWYINDDLSWEYTDNTAAPATVVSADETYKVYGAGIANNMRVNDNNLLIWGVSGAQWKHDYESGAVGGEEKVTILPWWFAALETDATSWLKVRIGASKAMISERAEPTGAGVTDYAKARYSGFQLSLGTGIRWNNLDIDMTLNDQFPLSGGYILSGNERTPFNRVSATYHF